jgi:phytoene dehydrogenase-like protein
MVRKTDYNLIIGIIISYLIIFTKSQTDRCQDYTLWRKQTSKEVDIITTSHYDVIVVGAGIAGLTSAAYLSKDGYRVLVIEKEPKNGGLVGAFVIDGHHVDRGARGIIDSGIFTPMIRQLGLDIELLPNPIRISVGKYSVDFKGKSSIDDYGTMLTELYPEHRQEIDRIIMEIKRVMGYMDVLYGIENPLFMPKPYDYSYLALTLLPWTMKFMVNIRQAMKLLDPINDYLRKITSNESLINIITQHFFESTPTFFALSYFSLYLDYLYPKGSTQTIVDSMVDFIEKNNGHICNGQEAVSIDATKRQIWVKSGSHYTYEQLIWAADLNMLYSCLNAELWPVSPLKEKVRHKQEFLSSKKGADSVLSLYIIVNQPPEAFQAVSGPHAFYTPSPQGLSGISLSDLMTEQSCFTDEQDRIFDWLEDFVKQNTLEISIPALRDPSLSPPGECALIVSLLFDYKLTKHIADLGMYEAFKTRITELMVANLDGYFPELSRHIIKTVITTPLTIAARSNNTEGSLTGWSFANHPFPAEYRFLRVSQSVLTPVDTIKQAGQWTFNPAGVPVSILTGKLAADAVIKDMKKKRPKGEV